MNFNIGSGLKTLTFHSFDRKIDKCDDGKLLFLMFVSFEIKYPYGNREYGGSYRVDTCNEQYH